MRPSFGSKPTISAKDRRRMRLMAAAGRGVGGLSIQSKANIAASREAAKALNTDPRRGEVVR